MKEWKVAPAEWQVTCYYRDPADRAINDTHIHVSDQSFYGTMIDLGVDLSILDHIELIEIRKNPYEYD